MKISIPLQLIDLHDDGVHILVKVTVCNTQFNVVVDTGASKTVFDHHMLLQAESPVEIVATEKLSAGLGTTSMQSFTAIVPDFKIGKLHLTQFEAAVLDLSSINDAYSQLNHPQVLGVLGGDILMQYQAVINYGSRKLYLTLREKI